MSNKQKGQKGRKPEKQPNTASYYDLKTESIEKLVNAKNAPPVSDAEIRK